MSLNQATEKVNRLRKTLDDVNRILHYDDLKDYSGSLDLDPPPASADELAFLMSFCQRLVLERNPNWSSSELKLLIEKLKEKYPLQLSPYRCTLQQIQYGLESEIRNLQSPERSTKGSPIPLWLPPQTFQERSKESRKVYDEFMSSVSSHHPPRLELWGMDYVKIVEYKGQLYNVAYTERIEKRRRIHQLVNESSDMWSDALNRLSSCIDIKIPRFERLAKLLIRYPTPLQQQNAFKQCSKYRLELAYLAYLRCADQGAFSAWQVWLIIMLNSICTSEAQRLGLRPEHVAGSLVPLYALLWANGLTNDVPRYREQIRNMTPQFDLWYAGYEEIVESKSN